MEYKVELLNRKNSEIADDVHEHIDLLIELWDSEDYIPTTGENFTFFDRQKQENGVSDLVAVRYEINNIMLAEGEIVVYVSSKIVTSEAYGDENID